MSSSRAEELQRVLVPSDLTASVDRAVDRLSLLALGEGARVTLLHVVSASLPSVERRRAIRDAHAKLAEEVDRVAARLGPYTFVHAVATVGTPAKEIATHATELQADLVIMGRGREQELRDHFLGSTAERVLRSTRHPVLVVQQVAGATYQRPALAVELDTSIGDIVAFMMRMLPTPRPRVDVVHAFAAPSTGLRCAPTIDASIVANEVLRLRVTRELTRLLTGALTKGDIGAERAPAWAMHVSCGSPRAAVQTATSNGDTDILILGRRGYSAAAYAFMGSVAADILRDSRCDVLVVPPVPRRVRVARGASGARRALREV